MFREIKNQFLLLTRGFYFDMPHGCFHSTYMNVIGDKDKAFNWLEKWAEEKKKEGIEVLLTREVKTKNPVVRLKF